MSEHLQTIKKEHTDVSAKWALHDKFPPPLKPEDGKLVTKLNLRYISYYFTDRVFIKREPHKEELGLNIYGDPCVNDHIADRLRNEAACLQFISQHTTVPVPKVLELGESHGLVYLKTEFISHGVGLEDITEAKLPAALQSVTAQLENDILPQLQQLRSYGRMGGPNVDIPAVAPRWLWAHRGELTWPSPRGEREEYSFCHTDLHRGNILVHPETFQIVGIIDWETAGFFPQEWEIPTWKADGQQGISQMVMEAVQREKEYCESLAKEQSH